MKLVNHLILRITIVFAVILFFWSAVYFFLQMAEIHSGNDEGLTNLKQEFIVKANTIPGFVETLKAYNPLNIMIEEIGQEEAEIVPEQFATTRVYFSTELEEEEVRMLTTAFFCEQNGRYYRLQFFTSTVESDDLIKNMFYLLLGLWLALSLSIFAVSKVIISSANRPFYKLLGKLKQFRLDSRETVDFPETDITEYAQLNRSVKELLEKNRNVFNEQKVFIENISHEWQTPLAIVIARLEMLIEKVQSDRQYTEELAAVLTILNRMKRLNRNLLLLSKIKNHQFPETEPVDLGKVLATVVSDFEDFAHYKRITVEREGDASFVVQMNSDLAHILLTNLVKNALVHNRPGGKVVIRSLAGSIMIANSGDEAATNVFSRYRGAATEDQSSGLGLSIVQSIAGLYRMQIAYRYDAMHIFTLSRQQEQ